MATYQVWHVEPDSTYSPLPGAEFTNKAKAIRLARALAKSEAFSDSFCVDVVCDEMAIESFKVKKCRS